MRKIQRPGLRIVEADLLSNEACGVDCLQMRYDVPSVSVQGYLEGLHK